MKKELLKTAKQFRRFASIPSSATRHFWLSLFLILILALVITGLFFYQYAILLPRERMADSRNLFEMDRGAYDKLMELKSKESLFEGEYPDLFEKRGEEPEGEDVD